MLVRAAGCRTFAVAFGLALAASAADETSARAAEETDAPAPTTSEGSAPKPVGEGADASPDVAPQTKLKTQKVEDATPTTRPHARSDDDDDDKPSDPKAFGHGLQFGLRFGVTFGYKMAFRYDHSPLCRSFDPSKTVTAQQQVCGYAAAPAADLALSFAILDGLEPFVFARFGFGEEANTNTKAVKVVGAGARLYTTSDSRLKLFIEPAFGLAFEGGAGDPRWSPATLNPDYKKDLLFHLGVGPQFDIVKYVGVYVNAGLDVGILRALTAAITGTIGAQVRVP